MYDHDVLMDHAAGPAWYRQLLAKAEKDDAYYARMLKIVTEELDKCNKYNDQTLLCAQAYGRLKELEDGKKK